MPSSVESSLSSNSNEPERGNVLGEIPVIYEEDDEQSETKERSCLERASQCWKESINSIRRPISDCVLAIALHAARNPYLYIIGIIHLSFTMVAYGLFTGFHMEVDAENLYTVYGSRIIEHKRWIDQESGFGKYNARMFILMVHADGANVAGNEGIRKCFNALNALTNTPGYTGVCSDAAYVGMDGSHTCDVRGVTRFWNGNLTQYSQQVTSDVAARAALSASAYPDGAAVDLPEILGNYQIDDDGNVTFAESYILTIPLPFTKEAKDFEAEALDKLLDMQKEWDQGGNSFRLEVQAERSPHDESEPLIPLVFVVMSGFTMFVFWSYDRVKSRTMVGFGAVVSVLLAVMTGYGFLFLLGVPFTMMTPILPFVMFGIGLDDAFIITGAFDRTDPRRDPVERMDLAFQEVGLSIFMTTATTSLAFGLGCISSIPAVGWLSLYAFPAVVFAFLYQISFFVAVCVLDARRMESNLMDCCCCITADRDLSNQPPIKRIRETPSHNVSLSRRFIAWFARAIMHPWIKVLVILSFAGLAVFCAIRMTRLKNDFKVSDVVPEDSYTLRFYGAMGEYGHRGKIIPAAYFRGVDQSNEQVQNEMEQFVKDLVSLDQFGFEPPFFWLRDFNLFVSSNSTYNSTSYVGALAFKEQLAVFLQDPGFQRTYGSDIILNEDGEILSSRCIMYMTNLDMDDTEDQIDAVYSQRRVASEQSINRGQDDWNFFTYEINYYIWEFFAVARKELLSTAATGIVSVSVLGFLLIPHWSAVFYVFPMITVLCVDLLGFLQICGVTINAVSYMAVMMSIGLLVDFIMHILLRYYESTKATREAKAIDSLEAMGHSLFLGGLTTFLGIVPLAFSSSKLLQTVFTAFAAMVALGVTHGLILLPVVLSLVGTTDCIRLESEDRISSIRAIIKKRHPHKTATSSDASQSGTTVSSITVSVDGGKSEGLEIVLVP
ncbi:patched domain containing [Seminavis robusta]|uniref:Patched domain containing n=1 Tax=Seminavis robusta TaxID=568900 RepID=A0A9N8E7U1_9STRA|nr:patched domain containing [Seminavis robusta]